MYYPETMNQLEDGAFRHLYAWGFNPRARDIRRVVEVDYLDETLLRDGFLDKYKVLVCAWGNIVEKDVAARIAKARQAADAEAARQREAERKARCAQQQGWMDTLRRDEDCKQG